MDQNDKYIGQILDDRYEIEELIGEGGMSMVYRATDRRLNRKVAVKIMRDDMAADEEFRSTFCSEGRLPVRRSTIDAISSARSPWDSSVRSRSTSSVQRS